MSNHAQVAKEEVQEEAKGVGVKWGKMTEN
jgi:hypothetical protein